MSDDVGSLGLAIVGCGQIVTHHVKAMTDKRVVVRALCDPSHERRQVIAQLVGQHQLTNNEDRVCQYDLLNDLIDDTNVFSTIDIIFIAVPHDLHETLCLAALATGKIVVLEKPLAPTRDGCDRLVQASLKNKNMLIVAEQSPYWQEVEMARQLIADGAIGHVVTCSSYYYESMRDNVTSGSVDESGGLGWRALLARAGGGIAIDGGLHWIRPIREMLGLRIVKVVGVVRRGLAPELQMQGESIGHALFQMESTGDEPEGAGPLVATYSCNMLATAPMAHDVCPYFRITGDGGELVIHGNGLFREEPGAGGLRLYNKDNPKGKELFPQDRMGGFFLGFAGLWQDILRMARTNDKVAAHESVVRAAADVCVVLAIYKSSETGQWETV
jgi:predicted dehydrogenase